MRVSHRGVLLGVGGDFLQRCGSLVHITAVKNAQVWVKGKDGVERGARDPNADGGIDGIFIPVVLSGIGVGGVAQALHYGFVWLEQMLCSSRVWVVSYLFIRYHTKYKALASMFSKLAGAWFVRCGVPPLLFVINFVVLIVYLPGVLSGHSFRLFSATGTSSAAVTGGLSSVSGLRGPFCRLI